MGLDMYLSVKHHLSEYTPREMALTVAIQNLYKPKVASLLRSANCGMTTIEFNVAYWRKANAIHHWFVEHVQGGEDECVKHYVPSSALNDLIRTCEKVLLVQHPDMARKLLPIGDFSHGDGHYEEHYWAQLQYTITALKRTLELININSDFSVFYRASW